MTSTAVLLDELIRHGGELKITRDDSHAAYSNTPRWTAIVFEPRKDSPYLRAAHTVTANTSIELLQKLGDLLEDAETDEVTVSV